MEKITKNAGHYSYNGRPFGFVTSRRGFIFYRSSKLPILEIMENEATGEVLEGVKIRDIIYKWSIEDRLPHQHLADFVNFIEKGLAYREKELLKHSFEYLIFDSFIKSEVIAMTITGCISYLEDTVLKKKEFRKDFEDYEEMENFQRIRNIAVHNFNNIKKFKDRDKKIDPQKEIEKFATKLEKKGTIVYYKINNERKINFNIEALSRCLSLSLKYIEFIDNQIQH
jgi:hypothetical protein